MKIECEREETSFISVARTCLALFAVSRIVEIWLWGVQYNGCMNRFARGEWADTFYGGAYLV